MSEEKEVDVEVITAQDLLSLELCIPPYQRAYTWKEKNIEKMIEDFSEFRNHKKNNADAKYYLGSILLHNNEGCNSFNIIDGQQRITTLLILYRLYFPPKTIGIIDIKYPNPKSQNQIGINAQFIKEHKDKWEPIFKDVFNEIEFTIIKTTNIDDAFTFFDTQNNRGVQPSVLVLLKAFNLRVINNPQSQIECAKKWESIENNNKHAAIYKTEESDKLNWLIQIFFYRVRHWRGDGTPKFEGYDVIRDGFTKGLRNTKEYEYKKFPSFKVNKSFKNDLEITIKSKNTNWFEFAIRQPIYQGKGFFMFVQHYSQLLDELIKFTINGKELHELIKVHSTGSRYSASFFIMVIATYYERFGTSELETFIKHLDCLLKEIRLEQTRILKQTMNIKLIRKNPKIPQNILDIICSAFDAEEVIEVIEVMIKARSLTEDKEIVSLKGVRERFETKHNDFWRT